MKTDVLPQKQENLCVLQVVPNLNIGGVERAAVEIAQHLCENNARALVASAGGRMELRLDRAGGELCRVQKMASKNFLDIIANTATLQQIIRNEGVQLVHARSRAPAWSAYWAAQKCKVPFLTTYHGAYSENNFLKKRYNQVMVKGDAVISISNYISDLIKTRYQVPDDKIFLIPRGADLSVFNEQAVATSRMLALTKAWNIQEDMRPLIMLPGRLTEWKGHEHFIEAAEILKTRRGNNFICLIVGDSGKPEYSRHLETLVKKLNLEDCLRMVGACQDMPAAYKLCSVVVSASTRPEAFGRVAVEAQAMRRPIIATNHGGSQETVLHEQTGWLYKPGSAEELAHYMELGLDQTLEARIQMTQQGLDHVRAHYTIAHMQAATLDVYRQLTSRKQE